MRLEFFEMIDRVASFDDVAKTIVTQSLVPRASPVFEGHFPNHPLVPGVLLTETMAQASGYLVLKLLDFSQMPFLMAVDKARFRTFVEPGAELETTATLVLEGSGYAATKARIRSGATAICDAELRFRLTPFPGSMRDLLLARSRQIHLIGETAHA